MRMIDADALKEKIDSMWNGRPLSSLGARILVTIDEAPTIDADRPQGEWISNHDGYWICSECGLRVLIYAKGNFCPNCGADMREREGE